MPHYRFDTFSTLSTLKRSPWPCVCQHQYDMYAFSFLIHFQERFKIEMRFRWKRAQRTVCVWTEGLSILYASFKRKRNSVPTAPNWLILRYINSNYCVFTAELIISLKQVIPWKKGKSIFLNKGRFRLLYTWERYALPPMPRQWTGSAFRTDDICTTWIISL